MKLLTTVAIIALGTATAAYAADTQSAPMNAPAAGTGSSSTSMPSQQRPAAHKAQSQAMDKSARNERMGRGTKGNDATENQQTAELNQQQLSGNGAPQTATQPSGGAVGRPMP